jgi:hypothetical protein
MNLKAEDQRTAPRVGVQFHAMVSGSVQSEGTGIILDLSRRGCRLESALLMLPGLSLELRIAVPGLEWALMIDGADVQCPSTGGQVLFCAFHGPRHRPMTRVLNAVCLLHLAVP